MRKALLPLSIGALLAAGCSKQGAAGPWVTMPDAIGHAVNFPVAPGDTHGPGAGQAALDCNGCHWDKAATPPGPSASFKVFTCTNCHVLLRSGLYHDDAQASFSTWHVAAGVSTFDATVAAANLPGVAKLDAACRSCHPSGIAVDHAVRFKLPHQDAAGTIVAACADCHVNPADRTQLGCASCHPHDLPATTTGHALVPDFSATSSNLCARCHEDGKIPVAVSAHAAGAGGFVVGTGLHAGATGGACLTCHDQAKAAPRAFVANFAATNCVPCHVTVGGTAFHDDLASLTTLHAPVPTFTSTVTSLGLSAACLSCHPDGGVGAPANHEQLFPRAAGTKHAGIACSQCHGTGLRSDLTALRCDQCHPTPSDPGFAANHANPGGIAILTVHTSQATTGPALTLTSPNCLRCHADSQVNLVAAHTTSDQGFGKTPHQAAGCVTCHTAARSDKPFPAVDFGSATGCVTCHPGGIPN